MGELYNPFPKLPKNIRQIGESDPVVRFYMEDYVNTYLKRLYPIGQQTIRVGLLLGNVEYCDGMPYVFIDGAMEMEEVETDGEKVLFSENAWKKAYQKIEETFPKRTIQGWFLCGGTGSQLSPLNYWKQHCQYFAGKNQLMYLNHGLEQEESIYITSEDGFYRLKGYCIYYERNQMMQDYMITRKDVRRVESASQETVIRDFRTRLETKKAHATAQSRVINAMGVLCGILAIAVLAGGVTLVNNYAKMQQMESVLASVLPDNAKEWDKPVSTGEGELIIEEASGNVYPTQERHESYHEAVQRETENSMAETADAEDIHDIGNEEIQAEMDQTSEQVADQTSDENERLNHLPESNTLQVDYEAAAASGYQIYEVEKGETLYGICWKQYESLSRLEEICRLNHLENVDRILAGQKLILP